MEHEVVIYHSYHALSKYTTIAMTALRWSSVVECIKWVPCWPWTKSAYVCRSSLIGACVIKFEGVVGVYCSIWRCCNLTLICCPNTLLIVVLTLAGQTERKFALLTDYALEFEGLLVIDAVWGRNLTLTLIMCCSNLPRWRLCVDLGWLNIWDGSRVLTLDEQNVRVSVCASLHLNVLFVFNAVSDRNLTLMRYVVVQILYNVDDGSALISNECV